MPRSSRARLPPHALSRRCRRFSWCTGVRTAKRPSIRRGGTALRLCGQRGAAGFWKSRARVTAARTGGRVSGAINARWSRGSQLSLRSRPGLTGRTRQRPLLKDLVYSTSANLKLDAFVPRSAHACSRGHSRARRWLGSWRQDDVCHAALRAARARRPGVVFNRLSAHAGSRHTRISSLMCARRSVSCATSMRASTSIPPASSSWESPPAARS